MAICSKSGAVCAQKLGTFEHCKCLHTPVYRFTPHKLEMKIKYNFQLFWTSVHWSCATFQLSHSSLMEGRASLGRGSLVVLETRGRAGEAWRTQRNWCVHHLTTSHCWEPGNSLILSNEPGWLGACFGEKRGSWGLKTRENVRVICKGNEVDIKDGYCPSLHQPSLIPLWVFILHTASVSSLMAV